METKEIKTLQFYTVGPEFTYMKKYYNYEKYGIAKIWSYRFWVIRI